MNELGRSPFDDASGQELLAWLAARGVGASPSGIGGQPLTLHYVEEPVTFTGESIEFTDIVPAGGNPVAIAFNITTPVEDDQGDSNINYGLNPTSGVFVSGAKVNGGTVGVKKSGGFNLLLTSDNTEFVAGEGTVGIWYLGF